MSVFRAFAGFIIVASLTGAAHAADPAAASAAIARGKDAFLEQCALCHQVTPGDGGNQGPLLKGVVGRKMAAIPGFAYSKGLLAKGQVWTKKNLDTFLSDPSAFIAGTRMSVNVGEADDRADLIAFLESMK